jgi:16S rRNA (adenine1518-N6/adenine1519-N6)-dimethyltransferase
MTFSSPRKRFGQHFLRDPQIIQRLVMAIAPHREQHLVEIGPGKGALTIPLLQQGCQLDVIELDRDLVRQLEPLVSSSSQLRIYQADALKFDFKQLVTHGQLLRIVGNLPYNISTPLLFHLLNYANDIQDMTFMLQKEVVDRMVAVPATAEYGRLSVMLQYHCQMERLFEVGPGAFYPPPKVESSVVQLKPYLTPPVQVANQQHFAQIVARAFSQRRKMLRNTLKGLLEVETIVAAGIDPRARAETLTLGDFAKLANATADDGDDGEVKNAVQ